jgi:opacity protein-like surface antigen
MKIIQISLLSGCALFTGLLFAQGPYRPLEPRKEAPAREQAPRSYEVAPAYGYGETHPYGAFEFLEGRVAIGIQMYRHSLKDTSRPEDTNREQTFLGYINDLSIVDDSSFSLFLQLHLIEYVYLELSHDKISARTRNFNNELSDGNVEMSGLIFSVFGHYTFHERFTPFIGIGLAPWSASFKHDEWWTLGWSSPESYEAAGRPGTSRGRRRIIDVEDDTGTVFTLGLRINIVEHLDVSLQYRQISLNSEATFSSGAENDLELRRMGSFPLTHSSYGIGLRYLF